MVLIHIDDKVWEEYKSSWALLGVRIDEEVVKMLEDGLWEDSQDVLETSEEYLIDDTPEAYVRREIGLEKEKMKKQYRQEIPNKS
jgi:hypothetical protein